MDHSFIRKEQPSSWEVLTFEWMKRFIIFLPYSIYVPPLLVFCLLFPSFPKSVFLFAPETCENSWGAGRRRRKGEGEEGGQLNKGLREERQKWWDDIFNNVCRKHDVRLDEVSHLSKFQKQCLWEAICVCAVCVCTFFSRADWYISALAK